MQCKGQDYMMLKDTTCKHLLETYLALANVPMWHYGFKLSPNSIIHYPTFLGPLPLEIIMIGLAFGPTNSPPLESNNEKEDISSTSDVSP